MTSSITSNSILILSMFLKSGDFRNLLSNLPCISLRNSTLISLSTFCCRPIINPLKLTSPKKGKNKSFFSEEDTAFLVATYSITSQQERQCSSYTLQTYFDSITVMYSVDCELNNLFNYFCYKHFKSTSDNSTNQNYLHSLNIILFIDINYCRKD